MTPSSAVLVAVIDGVKIDALVMLVSDATDVSSIATADDVISERVPWSMRVVTSSVQSNLSHKPVSQLPSSRSSVSVDWNVVDDIVDIDADTTMSDSALSSVGADTSIGASSGYSGGLVCQLDAFHDCMPPESLSNTTSSVDVSVVNVACGISGDVERDTLLASDVDDRISVSVKNGYSGGLVCQLDCPHDWTSQTSRSSVRTSTSDRLSRLPDERKEPSVIASDMSVSVVISARIGSKYGVSGGDVGHERVSREPTPHIRCLNCVSSSVPSDDIFADNRFCDIRISSALSNEIASASSGTTYGVFGGDGCHSNESYSSSFQMPPSNIYITHPHLRYP